MSGWPARLPKIFKGIFVLWLVSGAYAASAEAQAPVNDDVVRAIQILLAAKGTGDAGNLPLQQFYRARGDVPAWSDGRDLKAAGAMLNRALEQAYLDGLDPNRYLVPEAEGSAQAIAARDVGLTAVALRFAGDLRTGRPDLRTIDRDVDLSNRYDPVPDLVDALRGGDLADFLENLPPRIPAYASLKKALANYRAILAAGGWPQFNVKLPARVSDMTAGQKDLLQRRLAVEDETVPAGKAADIESALRRFQSRNGLEPDGVIGQRTLAALNIPVETRILQIIANMERLRWLPHDMETSYVLVNAPEAMLYVVKDRKVLFSSRVIVGRPSDPTPIFQGEITAVVANPPWKVPDVIARKEMLPALKRDAHYLADHHIVLENGPASDPSGTSIKWRLVSANAFPYRLQQLPGPDNALGTVKLDVSDPFAVYLHDTPAKALFSQTARAYSHGCIRVQQIRALASYALAGDETSGLAQLDEMIATAATQRAGLKSPIPLYVVYETVFVSAEGTVQFRPDIYGRDERMIDVLRGSRSAGLKAVMSCANG